MIEKDKIKVLKSGAILRGQNRIEHIVDFLEGLLLVKLPEGLIGNRIILMGSGCWQLVSSNPATGNQTMFVAATPDAQGAQASPPHNASPFVSLAHTLYIDRFVQSLLSLPPHTMLILRTSYKNLCDVRTDRDLSSAAMHAQQRTAAQQRLSYRCMYYGTMYMCTVEFR